MSNVKVKLGSKGMIIALIIGVLLLGGGGGYLLWRVNQPKTVAPTESDAYVPKMCRRCKPGVCLGCVTYKTTGISYCDLSSCVNSEPNGDHCVGCNYEDRYCSLDDTEEYVCGVDKYHITFNAGGGGTVTKAGQNKVDPGGSISSEARPNTGYQFNGWTGSGGGTVSDLNNPILTISNVNSDGTYTANFGVKPPTTVTVKYTVSPEGKGKVVNTNGVDITNQTLTVNKGSTVKATATAIAGNGYRFQKWEDAAGEKNATRTDIINENKTFKAIFESIPAEKVAVKYTVSPEGAGKVVDKDGRDITNQSQTVNKGTSVKVTAVPESEYKFKKWADKADGVDITRTDTINENKTFTAIFEKLPPGTVTLQYIVSPTAGGKVVDKDGNDVTNKIYTITKGSDGPYVKAVPNKGYIFGQWCEITGGIEACQRGGGAERTDKGLSSNKVYEAGFYKAGLVNCTDFGLSCGENNTILVSWKSVPGAIRYVVRINKEPKDDWVNEAGGDEYRSLDSSVLSTTIENVESGKIYGISVVAYDGPNEKADFHPSCGLTGLGDVWEPPLYQEIACEGTTPIVVPDDIDTVPDTAIFDDTKDTILLGFGILVVGLGWTWIATLPKKAYKLVSDTSDSFSRHVSNVKIKQEKNVRDSRRNRLERRIK